MRTKRQDIAECREYAKHSTLCCDWCDREALWLLVDPCEGSESLVDRVCADHASMYGAGMVWHDLFPPYGALLPKGGTARVVADTLAGL